MKKRKSQLSIRIISDIHKILKYLQIGTIIPIWSEFNKYIESDLNHFHSKSILLIETTDVENIVGHILIFHNDREILYFGFFGVIDDDKEKIEFLIKALINHAQENNFKLILGPINVPIIIFGWGFMEEGSLTDLFIGKPVNPVIYQKMFIQNGFSIKTKELSWEGDFKKMSAEKMNKFDFSEYELFHPKDWDEVIKYKKIFLELNARNLAPESVLTPDIGNLFENYVDFIKRYGDLFMFLLVKLKKTSEIIGCMICIPNPFRKDDQGNYDSFTPFSIVVDKEYRQKGISLLLLKTMAEQARERHIRYSSVPVESRQKLSIFLVKAKAGLFHARTHLILEYTF